MTIVQMSTYIDFTENAVNKLKSLISNPENEKLHLRIYIVGGGCSGFKYGFALDDKIHEDDIVIQKNGMTIVINALCAPYLNNAVVDYKESLQGSQFLVHNPNAETTCGCGSSFSLKEE